MRKLTVVFVIVLVIVFGIREYASCKSYRPSNTLSPELRNYTYGLCKKNNISFKVFVGLMWKESKFNPKAISKDGKDKGICQVRAYLYKKEMMGLKITNIMDPKQNIKLAIYILSKHIKKYKKENYHIVLMCYNMGEGSAKQLWKNGKYSTAYSRDIINYSKKL